MSRADRLKEELTWLKLFFAGFLAIDVSVIAWLAQNYDTAETVLLLGVFVVIFAVTFGLVFIVRLAYKRIEKLEQC